MFVRHFSWEGHSSEMAEGIFGNSILNGLFKVASSRKLESIWQQTYKEPRPFQINDFKLNRHWQQLNVPLCLDRCRSAHLNSASSEDESNISLTLEMKSFLWIILPPCGYCHIDLTLRCSCLYTHWFHLLWFSLEEGYTSSNRGFGDELICPTFPCLMWEHVLVWDILLISGQLMLCVSSISDQLCWHPVWLHNLALL